MSAPTNRWAWAVLRSRYRDVEARLIARRSGDAERVDRLTVRIEQRYALFQAILGAERGHARAAARAMNLPDLVDRMGTASER